MEIWEPKPYLEPSGPHRAYYGIRLLFCLIYIYIYIYMHTHIYTNVYIYTYDFGGENLTEGGKLDTFVGR